MKAVDLILCIPISPWAFTNITQKQSLKTSKQYWRQNSTHYSEFYRYPWRGCGERSHWAQTHSKRNFVFPLFLFLCYFAFTEDAKVLNDDRITDTLDVLFVSSSVAKHLRNGQRISLFIWLLQAAINSFHREVLRIHRIHIHTHTHTTIRVNRPPLLGYWSAK